MASLITRVKRIRSGEVITPLVDSYYRKGSVSLSPAAIEVVTSLALRPQRDRTGAFSASSLGQCMRAQALAFQGEEGNTYVNAKQEAIFFNGSWLHLKWQGMLFDMGIVKEDKEGNPLLEIPLSIPELRLKGTADAICTVQGEDWLVDVKGLGPGYWIKMVAGIPKTYLWQQHAYLDALDMDRAMLLCENKATGEYREHHIFRSDPSHQEYLARLRALNYHMEHSQLPPVLSSYPLGDCQKCPFLLGCPNYNFDIQEIDL